MKGLDNATIAQLMQKGRSRNAYGPCVIEFEESDEAAIDVAEAFPQFANKQATTLYQGFSNAIKKANEADPDNPSPVMVKQSDQHVYLLHNERALLAVANASTNGNK